MSELITDPGVYIGQTLATLFAINITPTYVTAAVPPIALE